MILKKNIESIQNELAGKEVALVAVSKTKPVELLKEAYDLGIRDLGENKVQELAEKQQLLPDDIRWHMIGHLQRNKVKYIASFVHLIHSIDSLKLLKEVNKQAAKNGRTIACLLQIHIAMEESKFGLSGEEIDDTFLAEVGQLESIQIRGLMGMATFTSDEGQVRNEFASLKEIFDALSKRSLPANMEMEILSMGMSGDYLAAIEEGSNMIRVGSSIFGSRNP